MGSAAEETDRSDPISLPWLSRMLPREDVRVEQAEIAHEGWVWKRSRHLKLWRRRWMVLTTDGQLFTFEDSTQRGGATEHVYGCQPLVSPRQASSSAGSDSSGASSEEGFENPVAIQVVYLSRRRALLSKFSSKTDLDPLRETTFYVDAGPSSNTRWAKVLHEVFSRPLQMNSLQDRAWPSLDSRDEEDNEAPLRDGLKRLRSLGQVPTAHQLQRHER
mmetsp:Transcript_13963/g.30383  ORF Transcript_13963/g.30383 Transcript_13963/m.30383 type:complete len:218 (-) Transcript_13963:31-684(-)